MNIEKKHISAQTSLAGEDIAEEKLRQVRNTGQQKRYRRLAALLIGIIIIAVALLIFGSRWCALVGHNWPTNDKLAYCSVCDHPNGKLVNASSDILLSSWTNQNVEFSLENGKKVDCAVLQPMSAIESCYSITLCLRIDELTAGNVLGEWGFYIRDLDGQWHLADTFVLEGDYVEAHFEFEEPVSFDAWACPCHVLGDSWSFSFSVWLQDATVFAYTG